MVRKCLLRLREFCQYIPTHIHRIPEYIQKEDIGIWEQKIAVALKRARTDEKASRGKYEMTMKESILSIRQIVEYPDNEMVKEALEDIFKVK